MQKLKQVIIINSELKMSKGKTAAQVAHASLGAFGCADKALRMEWIKRGQKKVVVKSGELRLEELQKKSDNLNLANFLVSDAGLTELEPGSITALGLGPDYEDEVDKVSGGLNLL